jgi:hypothetical protein
MKNEKKVLSILSMLIFVGMFSAPYFKGWFIMIPFAMCAIGGVSLGRLEHNNQNLSRDESTRM